MTTRHYRDRLEVKTYANSRAKQYRRALRVDLAEGISDYRRNGVTR